MSRTILKLFVLGVEKFNNKDFYDSHEYFEEIWSNYNINNRLYLQGLIQLSVAYFHISNNNINGGISLFNKAIKKMKQFESFEICVSDIDYVKVANVGEILSRACKSHSELLSINNPSDFNWNLTPQIVIQSEK